MLKAKEHFERELIFEEDMTAHALVKELLGDQEPVRLERALQEGKAEPDALVHENPSLLVADDEQIRTYIAQLFGAKFTVYQAGMAEEGLKLVSRASA
ncbi:hypothetical protein V9K67_22045 [Paraflavisolibacter sp. H34]|uniref:hypothetical protein n=1 Tax=Huijunlia imazamoxiresistens TaxID=3127457 RepID=UPI003016E7A6